MNRTLVAALSLAALTAPGIRAAAGPGQPSHNVSASLTVPATMQPPKQVWKADVVSPASFKAPSLKTTVDLRSTISRVGLAPRDQGGRPTCSVHATTFLLEYEASKKTRAGADRVSYSEEYLNYAANAVQYGFPKADGDYFSNLVKGYEAYGIASESDAPYQASYDPTWRPADSCFANKTRSMQLTYLKPMVPDSTAALVHEKGCTGQELEKILASLRNDAPVAVGIAWPSKDTFFAHEGALYMDAPSSPKIALGGHSVVLVGYGLHNSLPGGGFFIFRNSGGPSWGDHGYGYCTFDFVKTLIYDAVSCGQK